jgi:hypothetical protein
MLDERRAERRMHEILERLALRAGERALPLLEETYDESGPAGEGSPMVSELRAATALVAVGARLLDSIVHAAPVMSVRERKWAFRNMVRMMTPESGEHAAGLLAHALIVRRMTGRRYEAIMAGRTPDHRERGNRDDSRALRLLDRHFPLTVEDRTALKHSLIRFRDYERKTGSLSRSAANGSRFMAYLAGDSKILRGPNAVPLEELMEEHWQLALHTFEGESAKHAASIVLGPLEYERSLIADYDPGGVPEHGLELAPQLNVAWELADQRYASLLERLRALARKARARRRARPKPKGKATKARAPA